MPGPRLEIVQAGAGQPIPALRPFWRDGNGSRGLRHQAHISKAGAFSIDASTAQALTTDGWPQPMDGTRRRLRPPQRRPLSQSVNKAAQPGLLSLRRDSLLLTSPAMTNKTVTNKTGRKDAATTQSAATAPAPAGHRAALPTLDGGPATHILVLQGGGALGAYQWGAYEALAQTGRQPDWVAGISIGAINAALIAGNPPERRVERLTAFWERIGLVLPTLPDRPELPCNDRMLAVSSDLAAAAIVSFGLPGFFQLRPGAAMWPGPMPNPSFYDTAPLAETLHELVDFDRINRGDVRLSVGAVDVETGNMAYFDNTERRIGVEHIMASGALPPAFPAIQIDGRWYWDGGLVSNTPLRYVADHLAGRSRATILQVDLFSARGPMPGTHVDVEERIKDIRYSSRTRAVTDQWAARVAQHRRMRELAALLPVAQRTSPEIQQLLADIDDPAITLVHLIYRQPDYLSQHKDYEFSARTLNTHRQSGHRDMAHSLKRLDALPTLQSPCDFRVYDWCSAGRRGLHGGSDSLPDGAGEA